MTSMSNWTLQDLIEFTQLAVEMDMLHCEHCGVVPVGTGDKYCLGCTADLVDDLAARVQEQQQVEKGLY